MGKLIDKWTAVIKNRDMGRMHELADQLRMPKQSGVPYFLFEIACQYGWLEGAQWVFARFPGINVRGNRDQPMEFACYNGHLEMVKWLVSVGSDIDVPATFKTACSYVELDIAQWLFDTFPDVPSIPKADVHQFINYNHLEFTVWFMRAFKLDVRAFDNYALDQACIFSLDYRVICWLLSHYTAEEFWSPAIQMLVENRVWDDIDHMTHERAKFMAEIAPGIHAAAAKN